jgi:hypothetical protein
MIYILVPEEAQRMSRALDLLEFDHEYLDTWNPVTNQHQLPSNHQGCLTFVDPIFLARLVHNQGIQPVLDYADHNHILVGNDIMNSSCWRCMGTISPAYKQLEPLFDHPRVWRLCDDAHVSNQEVEILSSWWYALDLGSLVAPALQSHVTRTNQFFAAINGYRPNRQQILNQLDQLGLIEKNFVIYHGHQGSDSMRSRLVSHEPFSDCAPRRLSRDLHIEYEACHINSWYHEFSLELVLEALVEESLVSEKTVRPILGRMPFVILAGAGHLAYLRKLGFKTFDHLIDESYDQETNISDRIKKIIDVLVALDRQPNGFLDFYQACDQILEHNFDHLFWLNGRKDLDYSISLRKYIDQCKIATSTTVHHSWHMSKRDYYQGMAALAKGPWFDHDSGKDHYLKD